MSKRQPSVNAVQTAVRSRGRRRLSRVVDIGRRLRNASVTLTDCPLNFLECQVAAANTIKNDLCSFENFEKCLSLIKDVQHDDHLAFASTVEELELACRCACDPRITHIKAHNVHIICTSLSDNNANITFTLQVRSHDITVHVVTLIGGTLFVIALHLPVQKAAGGSALLGRPHAAVRLAQPARRLRGSRCRHSRRHSKALRLRPCTTR